MIKKPLLDEYYQQVKSIILDRQNPISGLLPASTAINTHGNYTDAWVRDNVYSILAAWGLAIAYRKTDESAGKAYLLEQSVVKLMRGLLSAMMRQAHKVERFKHSQDPADSLHAKYATDTGDPVVGDNEWGHLQLDATSLFLLMLAQMTASGLRIIFTLDEVNFVQNLVHYISRAYRTPDYGIWERGNKSNHGIAELNASSVGMAKAALEAMKGFNLFGPNGGQASVIHVLSDEIARTRIALEALLPRESLSKEVDSAVLSVIGYPAFAIEDTELIAETERQIREKLQGKYGCKRFLLDGHQTVIEDSNRLHYEPHELKQFMHIECEWPLFFSYLLLNKLFARDLDGASDYRNKLESLLVDQQGQRLLPELYIVEQHHIESEKETPGSQPRVANENIPLVWAQSLYILGSLIQDGLLELADLDPLGRRHCIGRCRNRKIQFALLAEDEAVQNRLDEYGISTQTLTETAPIQVRESAQLTDAYTQVGRNERLGLSGRPQRQIRSLGTALLYKLAEQRIVFLPQFLNQRGFYLALDNRFLVERLRMELSYIYQHWDRPGSPLVVMMIKPNMLDSKGLPVLLELISEMQQGTVMDLPIQLGRLTEFVPTSSHEQIDHLHDFHFPDARWQEFNDPDHHWLPTDPDAIQTVAADTVNGWQNDSDDHLQHLLTSTGNLYAQFAIIDILLRRHHLDHGLHLPDKGDCSIRQLLEEIYTRAGDKHEWSLVRRSAGLLGKHDIDLEQSAAEILIRQKRLTVGQEYSDRATFKRPPLTQELLERISTYNSNDAGIHIIIQELIIYLGILIKSHPKLFTDMHTVRVGHIMQLIMVRHRRKQGGELEDAFNDMLAMSPHHLAQQVKETLADYQNSEAELNLSELLRYEGQFKHLSTARFTEQLNPKDRGNTQDWHEWREQLGAVGRENEIFYAAVWGILQHCNGLLIGDSMHRKRLLVSEDILSQMTAKEQSFVLLVSHRLNKIQSPDYRQLTAETLQVLAMILQDHPDLYVDDILITETLIQHAVRLAWLKQHPHRGQQYELDHALSWQAFYQLPPNEVANSIVDALNHLLDSHKR